MGRTSKKNIVSNIILFVILIAGICIMGYPVFSNWWNTRVQTQAVAAYDKAVENLSPADYSEIFQKAYDYNKQIGQLSSPFTDYEQVPDYENTLDITGMGIMGYISIPQINIQLPIYHGTEPEVLNIAVGHMQGSTLPVGGEHTNAVLSAHRGLPSAKLFSDLDKLVVGDQFTITILDQVLTYEVEEILIVLPEKIEELYPIEDKDLVTLMTCTPYGVNSHRMLLRSHRVDTVYPHNVTVSADSIAVDPMIVFPVILAPMVIILIGYWIFGGKSGEFNPKKFIESEKEKDEK